MPAETVFLDTVALLALLNRDDALHAQAKSVQNSLAVERTTLLTSDWVLTELLGAASKLPLRIPACRLIERLHRSPRTEIVPTTRQHWQEAFDLFTSRSDKEWSLVDCSSILICHQRGVSKVFTHDRHFAQAGFALLM